MQTERRAEAGRRHALVVDGEDTFTAMLAHLLRSSGLAVTVRRYDEPGLREAALAHPGPVVLGPGPGDPRRRGGPEDAACCGRWRPNWCAEHRHGLLGVCLGHELIAAELGLEIVRKAGAVPGGAGADRPVRPAGDRRLLQHASPRGATTPTAEELAMHGVELSRDPVTGEVHALRGPGFAGVQFHPESVLTLDGAAIVAELMSAVRVA